MDVHLYTKYGSILVLSGPQAFFSRRPLPTHRVVVGKGRRAKTGLAIRSFFDARARITTLGYGRNVN